MGAVSLKGLKYPMPSRSLGIGVRTDDSGERPWAEAPYYWDGRLDEIAVFNDALTADEIKKLANAPPR